MAIYKKLLDFQKQNLKVVKDGKNPHFKSTYPTLNSVLDKVTKPLNDLGIVIVQTPDWTEIDGVAPTFGLTTELIDTEDDTRVECFMPYVGATDAQKLGSANTYNRRYSLVTLLGLEDEDDDGNAASAPKAAPRAAQSVQGLPVSVTEVKGEPFEGNAFERKNTLEASDLDTINLD